MLFECLYLLENGVQKDSFGGPNLPAQFSDVISSSVDCLC